MQSVRHRFPQPSLNASPDLIPSPNPNANRNPRPTHHTDPTPDQADAAELEQLSEYELRLEQMARDVRPG